MTLVLSVAKRVVPSSQIAENTPGADEEELSQ
jgi:hypothetical protein